MRIFLLSILLIISSTTPVKAETSGCPDSWKIDTTSNNGIQELQQAKQTLGTDMALVEGKITYTDFSGINGKMIPPIGNSLDIQDVLLYGNTKVQKTMSVQVKNCMQGKDFVISLGTLKDFYAVSNISFIEDPVLWANTNEKMFTDFTFVSKFSSCYQSQIEALTKPGQVNPQVNGNRLNLLTDPWTRNLFSNGMCGLHKAFLLAELTQGCKWSGQPPTRRIGISIPLGGTCDVAFMVFIDGHSLNVLPKFTIRADNWKISITCVKGKVKQIISGYQEFQLKCPKGYVKK